MKSICKLFFVSAVVSVYSTAWAFEEIGNPSRDITSMERPPDREVGYKWYFVDQEGVESFSELVVVDGDKQTWRDGNTGCTYTTSKDGFAPNYSWENCGDDGSSSGSQDVVLDKGSIWPLEVGNKFRFRVTNGRNSQGNSWRGTTKCKVSKAVRVRTSQGEYDTLKVSCSDKWRTRDRYVSPDVNTTVVYRRVRNGRGLEAEIEWLRSAN